MAKKLKEKKDKKVGFFGEVKEEMKMVRWPSFKDVVKYTSATVVMCLIFIGFFLLITSGVAAVLGMFK